MRQVRRGVFETNSSSVHTLTICTEEEFKKFSSGELLVVDWNLPLQGTEWEEVKFIPSDVARELTKKYLEKDFDDERYDDDDITEEMNCYFEFYDDSNDYTYEHYEEHFVTPSGDEMVVFGKYGRDG